MGGKRDTPIDYKLAHLHSQLSYAPSCGSHRSRKTYYNTDSGFVKQKIPPAAKICVFAPQRAGSLLRASFGRPQTADRSPPPCFGTQGGLCAGVEDAVRLAGQEHGPDAALAAVGNAGADFRSRSRIRSRLADPSKEYIILYYNDELFISDGDELYHMGLILP